MSGTPFNPPWFVAPSQNPPAALNRFTTVLGTSGFLLCAYAEAQLGITGTLRFIQLHDSAVEPALGTPPLFTRGVRRMAGAADVPSQGFCAWNFFSTGLYFPFGLGITIAVSSTQATYTPVLVGEASFTILYWDQT